MIDINLINRRIICNESIGTIKFVGYLDDTIKDVYYGIEWDDVTRGKHDGTYKGKKYFETNHPTSGSFLRPNKIEFGFDIYTAAIDKYATDTDAIKKEVDDDNQDRLLFDNTISIEKLKIISLGHCKISSVDTIDKLKQKFPFLLEMDLEQNLLNSWSQVFTVLNSYLNLRLINLTNNKLSFDDDNHSIVYDNVNYLILNRMNYDWNDILKVLNYFPKVNQLKVCFNKIHKINDINQNISKYLKIIDLESNDFNNNWNNILKLGELNELEELLLNNTNISEIYFNDVKHGELTNFFPKLKSLSLNSNKISTWTSINELNKLKCLNDLRFLNNPLNLNDTKSNIRELMIARIEKLKLFNRTFIETFERNGSEFDYIKRNYQRYLNHVEKANDDNEKLEFLNEHPRYLRLIEKYGAPEPSEVEIKPETIKSNLISLNIINDVNKEKIIRKIQLSMTIQRLKFLVAKLFSKSGFNNDNIKLIYTSSKVIRKSLIIGLIMFSFVSISIIRI